MQESWDPDRHHVFRWSWRKINGMARGTGIALGLCMGVFVIISTLKAPPTIYTPAQWLGISAGFALGIGLAGGLMVWAILAIARASTGTIVFPNGLLIRQALWLTRFVAWNDIASVELRDSGWLYAFIRRSSGGPQLAMSLELDDADALRLAIERAAPEACPVRKIFR